jgi:hypothetical protein
VRILAELGVLDQARAAGAVPIDRFTLVNEDVRIDGVVEPREFGGPGSVPAPPDSGRAARAGRGGGRRRGAHRLPGQGADHRLRARGGDRDRQFTAGLATWPELADLLAGARRVGPIRLMTDWHGYFRQSTGPGWVLVGDAGHFKDFTPAQGISDALRQARQLAPGIERGLGATGSIDTEMLRWWRWRDRDAYEMYWFARDLGAPGRSSPLVTRVLRHIAASRDATMALLRVLNHDQPPAQLLTPGRLAASALRALRDRPDQIQATLTEIAAVIRDEVRRARRRRLTPPGTPALASSPLVSFG